MQEKVNFSCDPVLNEYVSTHQEALAQLSFHELVSSDLEFQQAVFRSYNPAKQRDLWLKKIQYLLDNEKYSADEYAHVKSLLDHLHENYFAKENLKSEASNRSRFKTNWIDVAKNKFGWTNRYISFVVYSLYTNQDQFELGVHALSSGVSVNNTGVSVNKINPTAKICSCSTNSSFCDMACSPNGCQKSTGCGWFWSETCDGNCLW
jgi:hypothetical protein